LFIKTFKNTLKQVILSGNSGVARGADGPGLQSGEGSPKMGVISRDVKASSSARPQGQIMWPRPHNGWPRPHSVVASASCILALWPRILFAWDNQHNWHAAVWCFHMLSVSVATNTDRQVLKYFSKYSPLTQYLNSI